MSLMPYAFPEIDTVVGKFKITLYSSITNLVIPTKNTIVKIGDLEEYVDRNLGVSQTSTLELTIQDDYSTYSPEGFWFKVLSAECHVNIMLVEGVSDTPYFFGIPQDESIEWKELSLVGSQRQRQCRLTLTSVVTKLMETPTIDWINVVLANKITTGIAYPPATTVHTAIPLVGFFSALLKASNLNSSYNSTDAYFFFGAQDLTFKIGPLINRSLNDLWIPVEYNNGAPALWDYFDSSKAVYLPKRFAKAGELLSHLLKNFGVILQMNYSGAIHMMQLIQRGRASTSACDFSERIVSSEIQQSSDLLGDAVRFTKYVDPTKYVWRSKKFAGSTANDFKTTEPPKDVSFDIDGQIIFDIDPADLGSGWFGRGWSLFAPEILGDPTTLKPIDGVTFRDYYNDLDVTASSSGNVRMEEALSGYFFLRFTNKFNQITRKYGRITANAGGSETHTLVHILARTQINDGASPKYYYANRVRKSAADSQCEIEWIEE